jgi:hypothetical protein
MEKEWEDVYQRRASDTILNLVSTVYHFIAFLAYLVQMRQYHSK